jgi:hypothetical protein
MSFNINDSSKFAKDKSVICDYYDSSIYFNQYERTPNNGGYIKIPYSTPQNIVKPNGLFISDKPTTKYMSSSLQIYKKTHDIGGIDYDGELVIENKQITNGDSKLFVCFPLKTSNIKSNKIDEIISKSEKRNSDDLKTTVNLNIMFNKLQKYIFYKNGNDIVIVFTEPIKVFSMFDKKFIKCTLFSPYSDNYNILQNVAGKEGFIEGFVEGLSSGEMDCTPIDVTTNKPLADLPTIVGLTSGTAEQQKTISILFSIIIFIIVFFIAFFGIPPAYKYIFANDDKLTDESLTYTTIFIIFYLLLAISLTCGIIFGDTSSFLTGLTFWVLFLISISIIYSKRQSLGISNYELKFGENGEAWKSFKYIFLDYYYNLYQDIRYQNKIKYLWGLITTIISLIISIISLLLPNTMKIKSKINLARKKNEAKRKKYSIAMISVFGLVYGIFIVGPFVGFIAKRE